MPDTASASASADRPQNLVVCCDGTNNTLTGGIEDTNVLLLYAYLRRKTAGTATVLFYDPGVGSPDAAPPTDPTDLLQRKLTRIAGLASGRGVYDNIADGYRFLMQHWRGADDRIFCFGFSRGAFTARCIVGMVNLFGLLRPEHEVLLPTLIRIYFSQPPEGEQVHGRKSWTRTLARALHHAAARPDKPVAEGVSTAEDALQMTRRDLAEQVKRNFARPAVVHWVGVWDTVESVGLPLLSSRDNPSTATFHDKPGIRNVRHALAFDEHRAAFLPRLYDAPSEVVDGPRTLKQLWFAGVHCDVGGGYLLTEAGLSDASLVWMFNEVAPEFGLPSLVALPAGGGSSPIHDDLGMPRRTPFPCATVKRHDALWDSPIWALGGMVLRDMRTRSVRTNAQQRLASARRQTGKPASGIGVTVDVKAFVPVAQPATAIAATAVTAVTAITAVNAVTAATSVWDERRKTWPLLLAAAAALLWLWLSGWNLQQAFTAGGDRAAAITAAGAAASTPGWAKAPAAACTFALQQLATLSPVALPAPWAGCGPVPAGGLRDALTWQGTLRMPVVWGIAFDFLFVSCLGYLIARLASRGFTFLAGQRRPGQPLPPWRAIGFLPLVAIGADVLENAATLLAMAAGVAGIGWLATALLVGVGLLSATKLAAYAGCMLVYLPLRVLIAVLPARRLGQVGRRAA